MTATHAVYDQMKISRLQMENERLKEQVRNRDYALDRVQDEIKRLKLQNDMIFTDAAGLTQAVDALAKANGELRAEIERRRTDYSILKSDYDAQRGDIETLQAELRYERIAHMTDLETEAEQLREIQRLNVHINKLDTEIDRLRAEKINLLNWLNTHHPHVVIAWSCAALEPKP